MEIQYLEKLSLHWEGEYEIVEYNTALRKK